MKTRMLFCTAIGVALLISGLSIQATTDIFSFAGYSFKEFNTPNRAALLGNGAELGGASFSTGYPTEVTLNTIDFPQPSNGFDVSLALNHLTGLSTNGVKPVRLPNGDQGETKRHGIEVFWSSGGGVRNSTGKDFVIYESASNTNAVEGVIARVRLSTAPETWTDWFYFPPTAFQRLQPDTANVESVFSYGFDLSDMGVGLQATADRIQMANLMQADRIQTVSPVDVGGGVFVGQGKVVFDGSSNVLPDAGSYDADRRFSSGAYDPDPLYVAVLHDACETAPPLMAFDSGSGSIGLSWPAPSCYLLESTSDLNSSWTNVTDSLLYSNGRYGASFSVGTGNRFFRLKKPVN